MEHLPWYSTKLMHKYYTAKLKATITNHFRTNIVRCSKNCIGASINRRHQLGNTKVAHFNDSFLCQENVRSFEISETTNDYNLTTNTSHSLLSIFLFSL